MHCLPLADEAIACFCSAVMSCYNRPAGNIIFSRASRMPHAHSPGVASGTVARRLRIDVHDIDNDDNDDDNDNA